MLAIVIPYYKMNFFRECLQSLSAQTDRNFKVYIGDDASPEDPGELIDKYRTRFPIEYKKFDKNLGKISLTRQWDRCIALTEQEEWLMILGDDDMLGENAVEEFYKALPVFKDKANVLRFATLSIDENSEHLSQPYIHPEWELAGNSYYRRFLQQTRSSLSEYIFKKEKYLEYGFADYPLAWHSDDKAWLDFSEKLPIFSINKALVYIRTSQFNISGKTNNVEAKATAQQQFLRYLISDKFHLYNKMQKHKILQYYEERLIEKENYNFREWSRLCYFNLLNFEPKRFEKFLKRSVKQLLYRNR